MKNGRLEKFIFKKRFSNTKKRHRFSLALSKEVRLKKFKKLCIRAKPQTL